MFVFKYQKLVFEIIQLFNIFFLLSQNYYKSYIFSKCFYYERLELFSGLFINFTKYVPQIPTVKCQAHFTGGGFEQFNKRHVSHILKRCDPRVSGSSTVALFIKECIFSWFHSDDGPQLVTKQLELSQPDWFKIPVHQSPRKMRQNLFIVHTFSTMPLQPGSARKKKKSFGELPNTVHLIDWVNYMLVIIKGVLEQRRGKINMAVCSPELRPQGTQINTCITGKMMYRVR